MPAVTQEKVGGVRRAVDDEGGDEEEEYRVETVVDVKQHRGIRRYKIRWKGYGESDDTWEPAEHLNEAALEEGDALYEEKRKTSALKRKNHRASVSGGTSKKKAKNRQTADDEQPLPSWAVPDASAPMLTVGSLTIDGLLHSHTVRPSYATSIFGNSRLLTIQVPLRKEGLPPLVTGFNFAGGATHYELLSSRVPKTSSKSQRYIQLAQRSDNVHLIYVATSGPNIREPLSLREKLESIADFAALSPTLAASRLHLLTSATNNVDKDSSIIEMKASDFKYFDDSRSATQLGCAFVPEDMMPRFNNGKQCFVVQVRVFAPRLGIFKGLFCAKRGIKRIELPKSMRKVGRSKTSADDWVCVVVKTRFPTDRNRQLGRELDPNCPSPPMSSFRSHKPQGPGDMIERLWKCLGVSESDCKQYNRRCNNKSSIQGIKHTYLVGVPDPTGNLPKGHIFVPGFGKQQGKRKKLFITRSPAIEPSDGHLLPVVNSKPKSVSKDDWEFLNSFPFGIVIFAGPRINGKPTPERIGGGDLDGDTYFLCWDVKILDLIKTVPVTEYEESPKLVRCRKSSVVSNNGSISSSEDWFSAAQNELVNVEKYHKIHQLTGKLYNASKRTADNSVHFMKSKTAILLARSYKLALDLEKHGGGLKVPDSVRERIPASLHELLEYDRKTSYGNTAM